jgi:predicted NBD/HSP70 family sugar kinase
MDDFVYLYLGEGLGCAVVSDGEVRRGHAGLAGKISHLITAGPRRARAGRPGGARGHRRPLGRRPGRPRRGARSP